MGGQSSKRRPIAYSGTVRSASAVVDGGLFNREAS